MARSRKWKGRLRVVDGEEKERFRHTETLIISLGGPGAFS